MTRVAALPALTIAMLAAGLVAAASAAAAPFSPPFRPMNPQAYANAKAQANEQAGVGAPLAPFTEPFAPGGPRAKVVSGLNLSGLDHTDNAVRNDGTPPDPTGAVGPNDYIEFVNSVVRLYDRDLTTVADTQQLDTFIGHTNDSVFDPQIQYDPAGQRWFYLADECAAASCLTQNFLAFGFSKTNDPSNMTTDWCTYRIRTDNLGGAGMFDDYPKLGHSNSQLLFGTNAFDAAGDFASARIWTLAKPSSTAITTCPAAPTAHYWTGTAASPVQDGNLAANPLRTSSGALAFTPVPANTQDASANGYVVAAGDPPGSTIMAWHVTNTGSLAADGNIAVSSFAMPASVPQPGTTDVIDSSDTRLTQAVAHADPDAAGAEAVWTQHTIDGPGGRSVDRWYELIPSTHTKRQEGAVSDPSNFVFNGAISPTMAGNEAVIQYNVGGSSQLAQIKAQSRVSARPLGAMGGEILLGTSTHFDQDFSCPAVDPANNPSCRWGDYAAATPDPGDNHVVWGTNQLIGDPVSGDPAAPHWTTRNFALAADGGPIASFTAAPNPVFTQKAVTFDATGSQDPNSGNLSFEWDFGNGVFVPGGAQISHSYDTPGSYAVRVRVSDDAGGTPDVASRTLTVVSGAPTASFAVSPTVVGRGQAATFDGSASRDAEAPGGIESYAWDFDGDGTPDQTTSGPTTTHSYDSPGSYNVRLVVTDADDHQASAPVSHAVTVQNVAPPPQLTPPVATTGATTGIGPESATLNATVDPRGQSTTFTFEYGTTTGYGRQAPLTPAPLGNASQPLAVTTALTGLKPGTTIHFRVVATNGMGTTQGADSTFKTRRLTVASSVSKTRLAKALSKGLRTRTRCNVACSANLELLLPAKLAKRLHLKRKIAGLKVAATPAGRVAQVRVARKIARRLAGQRSLALSLRITATTKTGGRTTVTKAVKLKR